MRKESIKKLIATALVFGSVLGVSNSVYAAVQENNNSGSVVSASSQKNAETAKGWHLVGKDGKEYFYKDGVLQNNSIITVWGTKFKCDANGVVVGDIVSDSDDVDQYMHQFSEDYKNNDKRWKKVNGNWHFCYLDDEMTEYSEDKITKDGWEEINKYWYHFNKNGDMDKNTIINDECGNECQLNADGALINRDSPMFNYEDDDDCGFKFIDKDGKTYCTDVNGKIKTSWVMKGGKWYYCNKDGIVQKNVTIIENDKKYVLDKDGVWVK